MPAADLGLVGYFGAPFRRLADARYLQPLYQVRPPNKENRYQAVLVNRLHPANYGVEEGCQIYRADFTPTESGKLFLYVNDAVGLFDRDSYYRNNRGRARVYLHDLSTLEPKELRKPNPGRCYIVPDVHPIAAPPKG